MALTVSLGYCPWLDGETFNAQLGRTMDVAGMNYSLTRGGVLGLTTGMAVTSTGSLNLSIAAGSAMCPATSGVTQGIYRVTSTGAQAVTLATADPSNPRLDRVVAAVIDNGNNTSSCYVGIVTGTPSSSPVLATAPSNSTTLAQVAVAAGATSITQGNITDLRAYTVAPGGILPLPSVGSPPTGANAQYAYDLANDRLFHLATTGPRQARVLPWAPQIASTTTTAISTGSEITILSVSVTVDGSTDLDISTQGNYLQQVGGSSHSTGFVSLRIYIDSTKVAETNTPLALVASFFTAPPLRHITTSGLSDTPSAGTHTVSWRMQPTNTGSDSIQMPSGAGAPMQLFVHAICI